MVSKDGGSVNCLNQKEVIKLKVKADGESIIKERKKFDETEEVEFIIETKTFYKSVLKIQLSSKDDKADNNNKDNKEDQVDKEDKDKISNKCICIPNSTTSNTHDSDKINKQVILNLELNKDFKDDGVHVDNKDSDFYNQITTVTLSKPITLSCFLSLNNSRINELFRKYYDLVVVSKQIRSSVGVELLSEFSGFTTLELLIKGEINLSSKDFNVTGWGLSETYVSNFYIIQEKSYSKCTFVLFIEDEVESENINEDKKQKKDNEGREIRKYFGLIVFVSENEFDKDEAYIDQLIPGKLLMY